MQIVKAAKDVDVTFEKTVEEAYVQFHRYFRDNLLSLIKTHPAIRKTFMAPLPLNEVLSAPISPSQDTNYIHSN